MKRIVHLYLFLCLTLTTGQVFAQVSVHTDTLKIRIGEQIEYRLQSDSLSQVVFPGVLELDSLHRIEQVRALPVDTLVNRLERKYLLTSFDTGYYRVPGQRVLIGGKTYTTRPVDIAVFGVEVDTARQKMYPIRPGIKAPQRSARDILSAYLPFLLWLLPVFAAVLVAGLLRRSRKKEKREKEKPLLPPYEEALQSLRQLGEDSSHRPAEAKAFYSQLTGILRRYLERAVGLPALELPTDEWIYLLEMRNRKNRWGMSPEDMSRIRQILTRADLVKFAKQQAAPSQMSADISETEQWIEHFHGKTYTPPEEETPLAETTADNNKKSKAIWLSIAALILFALIYALIKTTTGKHSPSGMFSGRYGYPPVGISTPGILTPLETEQDSHTSAYSWQDKSGFSVAVYTVAPPVQSRDSIFVRSLAEKWASRDGGQVGISRKGKSEERIGGLSAGLWQFGYKENGREMDLYLYLLHVREGMVALVFSYPVNDDKAAAFRRRIEQSIQIIQTENE